MQCVADVRRLPDHVWFPFKQSAVVANPGRVCEVVLPCYEVEDACCPVSYQERILHDRQTNNLKRHDDLSSESISVHN